MVKFHRQSNGDCLEALKRCLDPKMGHRSLVYGQKSINSKFPCMVIYSKVLLGDLKHIQKHVFSGTFGPKGLRIVFNYILYTILDNDS